MVPLHCVHMLAQDNLNIYCNLQDFICFLKVNLFCFSVKCLIKHIQGGESEELNEELTEQKQVDKLLFLIACKHLF